MEADPIYTSLMPIEYFDALNLNSYEITKVFSLSQFLS
jgi:hypothetical protein